MSSSLFILIGGSWNRDEFRHVKKLAKRGKVDDWPAPKDCSDGDRVLLYMIRPQSHLMAKAMVVEKSRKKRDGRYWVKIGGVDLIERPIRLTLLRMHFPNWGWAKSPRNATKVPKEIAEILWREVEPILPQKTLLDRRGAGFGDPETNRLVEEFAIEKAKQDLLQKGYTVRSVEREKIGYDLVASQKNKKLHVEVKGTSGPEILFILTAAELEKSKIDAAYRLFVVTSARTPNSELHRFSFEKQGFEHQFFLTPLAFRVVRKNDLKLS